MRKLFLLMLLPVLTYGQSVILDRGKVDTLRPKNDAQIYAPNKVWSESLNVSKALPVGSIKDTLTVHKTNIADIDAWQSNSADSIALALSQLRNQGIFNVVDYGADITGATSSSAAIQSAVDAVSSYGGEVRLPPTGSGHYLIDTPIYIRKSNIKITGAAFSAAQYGASKVKGSTTVFIIDYDAYAVEFQNLLIADAAVGIKTVIGKTYGNLFINKVDFYNISDKAIHFVDTSDGGTGLIKVSITDCQFHQTKYGVYSEHKNMLQDCLIANNWFTESVDGGINIRIGDTQYATNLVIRNSLFNGDAGSTVIPISLGDAGVVTIENMHISDYTRSAGVNDSIPIIQIRQGTTVGPNIKSLTVISPACVNPRGAVIDIKASSIGIITLVGGFMESGAFHPVIRNLENAAGFTNLGCRLDAPIYQYVSTNANTFTTTQTFTYALGRSQNLSYRKSGREEFGVDSTFSLRDGGYYFHIDASTGNRLYNLPKITSSMADGMPFMFKKNDASTNTVTIKANVDQLTSIDGDSVIVLRYKGESVELGASVPYAKWNVLNRGTAIQNAVIDSDTLKFYVNGTIFKAYK